MKMTEDQPQSLTVSTTRFGEITVPSAQVINLPHGMVGLAEQRRYALIRHQPQSAFYWLQSLDRPDLAFVLANPVLFKPDYNITLSGSHVKLLEVSDPNQIQVWVVVTIPRGNPRQMTANLKAPVVINLVNRRGAQIIMDDPSYSLRYPLGEGPSPEQGKDGGQP